MFDESRKCSLMTEIYCCLADGSRQAVEVIQGLIPVLGSEITTRVLNAISPLFVSVDRDVRSCLCDLLETVSQVDPSTHIVVKLVHMFP